MNDVRQRRALRDYKECTYQGQGPASSTTDAFQSDFCVSSPESTIAGSVRLGLLALAAGHAAGLTLPSAPAGQIYNSGHYVPADTFNPGVNINAGGFGIDSVFSGLARDLLTGLPVLPITLDDIVLAIDKSGKSKCCPRGTIFNGDKCVFPSSAVCPQGFRLEGNVCVGTKHPDCPSDLVYVDGVCVSPDLPICPGSTRFNRDTHRCESESNPECLAPLVAHGMICVSPKGPECSPGFKLVNGICVNTKSPECPSDDLILDRFGRCIGKEGPKCPRRRSRSATCANTSRGPGAPRGTSS